MKHDEVDDECEQSNFDRLYTPWRMSYVRGERQNPGCVFCSMRDSSDDAGNLILFRGANSYVVMNLFPYNTGHLLIVPNDHVASPEELSQEALHELADQLPRALTATRSALSPDAFNVGYNLGSEAGAGIAAHLHQHLVPRWRGDANFMPIIGGTKVLPELLPVTWTKLRAEFMRADVEAFQVLLTDRVRNRVLIDSCSFTLPQIRATEGAPVWKTALDLAAGAGAHSRLTGVASHSQRHILVLETDSLDPKHDTSRWIPVEDARSLIPATLRPLD